ncbi:MAG TPA: hypothetical protein VIE69_11215 [Methylophilaceae bacterium]|jgi:hypothetical protein
MNRFSVMIISATFCMITMGVVESAADAAPYPIPVTPPNNEKPSAIPLTPLPTTSTPAKVKTANKKTHKALPKNAMISPPSSAPWPNAPPPQTGLGGTPPPPKPPTN